MNSDWQSFLISEQAHFISETQLVFPENQPPGEKRLIPVTELAVLSVSGKDAGILLQGQVSCNINELSETQSSLGAMCNAKGRVITTFLVVKTPTAYLLVLPTELLSIVQKRLQLFVLRSDALITDSSGHYCLIGLYEPQTVSKALFSTRQSKGIYVNFGQRALIIASVADAIACWQQQKQLGFISGNSDEWAYSDMLDGIPWLSVKSSEQHIPQMLNLDKLGGISFNKGCYTGQEVVARTHYLGKAKRTLFLMSSETAISAEPNDLIVDDSTETEQAVGTVLVAKRNKLLAVLQLPVSDTQNFFLKHQPDCKLTLANV